MFWCSTVLGLLVAPAQYHTGKKTSQNGEVKWNRNSVTSFICTHSDIFSYPYPYLESRSCFKNTPFPIFSIYRIYVNYLSQLSLFIMWSPWIQTLPKSLNSKSTKTISTSTIQFWIIRILFVFWSCFNDSSWHPYRAFCVCKVLHVYYFITTCSHLSRTLKDWGCNLTSLTWEQVPLTTAGITSE